MNDLISRQAAIDYIDVVFPVDPMKSEYAQGIACGAALAKTYIKQLPSAQPEPSQVARDIATIIENEQDMRIVLSQPEIIRCKDCVHQEKFWHGDKRRKDGGYYIYGCELADGYSHVCLDDDFCSRAERRTDAID